ncbi:MAG: AsmA-like C-terminal region-containing protein [Puniceicoccales bacterium]|nr:AsmA-like C-terminal region-containing protein [Puniceicoccales bacterium]
MQFESLNFVVPKKCALLLQRCLGWKNVTCTSLSVCDAKLWGTNLSYKTPRCECTLPYLMIQSDLNVLHYFFKSTQHKIYVRQGSLRCDNVHLDKLNGYVQTSGAYRQIHLQGFWGIHPIHITGEKLNNIPSYLSCWLEKLSKVLPNMSASLPEMPISVYVHVNQRDCSVQIGAPQLTYHLTSTDILKIEDLQCFVKIFEERMHVIAKAKHGFYNETTFIDPQLSFQVEDDMSIRELMGHGHICGNFFHGVTTHPICFCVRVPHMDSQKTNTQLLLESETSYLQGRCTLLNFTPCQLDCFGKLQPDLLHRYFNANAYRVDFSRPTFFRSCYQKDKILQIAAEGCAFRVSEIPCDKIFLNAQFFMDTHAWMWHGQLHNARSNFKTCGSYWPQTQKGRLHLDGTLDPKITHLFKALLPDWWVPFWNDFTFSRQFPTTNFDFTWHNSNCRLNSFFGSVGARDFCYKQVYFNGVEVLLGNIAGYTLIDAKNVQTSSGRGSCQVDWQYGDCQDSRESWNVCGQGTYTWLDWHRLVNIFGMHKYGDKCSIFQDDSLAQANFKGVFCNDSALASQEAYLDVALNVPSTVVCSLPVKNLRVQARYTPSQLRIQEFCGLLDAQAPVTGMMHLSDDNRLSFLLKGENVSSEMLLQKLPCLKSWYDDIPEDNLPAYQGILDFYVSGQGEMGLLESFEAQGALTFSNANLAQMHLLGPLLKFFPKKLHLFSSVDFNLLKSQFELKNGILHSKETHMTGPSTHAKINGKINLLNKSLNAHILFSFLDYKQLKAPVMKQMMQLFQPILKGFSAKVTGTFRNPQWLFYFNPLNFILR